MIAVPLPSIAGHHPLGASTGVVGFGDDWPALVRHACGISPHAVELAALDAAELPGLKRLLAERPRLPFRCVSVHAPVKGLAGSDDASRAAELARLPLGVRSIVVHPDLIEDPAPYRALGRRLVIENMDDRKADGRTVQELAPLFAALPEAGFCLDVAHAHTVDPSMQVAAELLDAHRCRLREVHLSSIRDGSHVELTPEDELLFAPLLARCRDVPWILEAAPPARWAVPSRTRLRAVGESLAA
jgi:sugar phosphate isomerase/epimerase